MERIKLLILITCLLPVLLCSECDMDREYNIYMINDSQYDIISVTNPLLIDRGQTYTSYPDTTLSLNRAFLGIPQNKGKERYAFGGIDLSWEYIYKNIIINDTMSVFIFDSEILENIEWKEIRDNYMILKRYDLSLEDLQKLDFTLYYPPTEEMKDIKMYPPYEEQKRLRYVGKLRDYVLSNPLYMHEYGHYIDSQHLGLSYLTQIGIPSARSAKNSKHNHGTNLSTHDTFWAETRANRLAASYFERYGVDWIKYFEDEYPLNQ